MEDANSTAIMWFRNDLRICDNSALTLATQHNRFIPLFIYDESCGRPLGAAKKWWLHHALEHLSNKIEHLGNRLIIYQGSTETILRSVVEQTSAKALYWNRRYDPSVLELDARIKNAFSKDGLAVKSCAGFLMHEPTSFMNKSGTPFKVFTPFWRALDASLLSREPEMVPLPAPKKLPPAPKQLTCEPIEELNLLPPSNEPDWASPFLAHHRPGEDGAINIFHQFMTDGVDTYANKRDFPAQTGTSMLAPHLTFGEISPRQIWAACKNAPHTEPFRRQLGWRDFSYYLLMHNPELATQNFNPIFDKFIWHDKPDEYQKWAKGQTGYPIIDAGMRQLWQTGYMHNRVRMIVASFLTKHLLIDWRLGEKWFWDTLLDADPANNPAGWQWVAGSGADASPYYRIFNPIIQGQKFDPNGDYVRQYVPELLRLDKKYIHTPWDTPDDILLSADIQLGTSYPHPIIGHNFARKRALEAYEQLKAA